ncbi:hypothetical protein GCM10022204_05550 [Microlunatus aurantiacus]|uniref:Uncharacterized protein n=1 Tax=Microlunatus aurantiacus TaxID=446786 RepID=A0ABP7CQB8_9ACTN
MPFLKPPPDLGSGPRATVRVDPPPTDQSPPPADRGATREDADAGPDDPAEPSGRALAEIRAGLALVAADAEARRLRAETRTLADPDGALAGWLYGRWWCGLTEPAAWPGAAERAAHPAEDDPARGAARLEEARRTVAPTSDGWLVLAAAGQDLVAASLVEPDHHRLRTVVEAVTASSRPGCPPRPGDLVSLQHGSAGLDPSGSWWWAHAGRPEDTAEVPLDRWYLHARDLASAAAAVPLLLELAAAVGCALSLKCPPTAYGYGRRDALVAYLPSAAAPTAEPALRRRADRLLPLLSPEVPPCTRRLLPGVATAQDPGASGAATPVSYGQLRCAQLAAVAARFAGRDPSDEALTTALADLGADVAAIERVGR